MIERPDNPAAGAKPPRTAASFRALVWWYGLMTSAGLAFGLVAERRPFGAGFFAHPLVAFFILVGAVLLVLRVLLQRPVPDVIPERDLLLGCCAGLAAFLIGNFASAHLIAALR